jgi:L-ascorbate metabolism protein UlaG (beta-lactamase superfamily)
MTTLPERAQGDRAWPASFADRLTAPLPGYRDLVKVMRQGGFAPRDLSDAGRIPVRRDGLPRVDRDTAAVTWVGHATFVVTIGGKTVLTDPVWSRRIPGVKPRLTPAGVDWADLPPVDAVVISHNHYDHLDAPTIRRLPRHTPVFAPGGLGRWFRRRGFRQVTELDWWESAKVDGVALGFVPAHHWSRRTLLDTCRSLWGGWVLSTGDTKIYFAGDTGYGHWFGEIAEHHPDIDLALLPVGAYEPNWFMKPVHLNPPEAVRACLDLGAPRMATMHWGTFVLSAEPLLAPVREAAAAWAQAGRPREDLWDLAVGESRVLPPRS